MDPHSRWPVSNRNQRKNGIASLRWHTRETARPGRDRPPGPRRRDRRGPGAGDRAAGGPSAAAACGSGGRARQRGLIARGGATDQRVFLFRFGIKPHRDTSAHGKIPAQSLDLTQGLKKRPPQQNLWVRFGSGRLPRLCKRASFATSAVRNPYDFLVTSFTLLLSPSPPLARIIQIGANEGPLRRRIKPSPTRVGPTTPKQFLRNTRRALTWQFMYIPTEPWRWGRLKWVPRLAAP